MVKAKNLCIKILAIMVLMLIAVSTKTLATNINTVTGLKANFIEEKAYLEWNAVPGATGYEIYINVGGNGYYDLGTSKVNYVTIVGFKQGIVYHAKVKAYKEVNGQKEYSLNYSNEIEIKLPSSTTDVTKLEAVKNLKATVNGTKAELTWDKVNNASGYEVYVKIPNMNYCCLGAVSNNFATIQGLKEGQIYYAKVMAFRYVNGVKDYAKNYSNEVIFQNNGTAQTTKPAKVTGVKASVEKTVVTINWNQISDAAGYQIALTIPGGNTIYYTSTTNSIKISGITNTTSDYSVKVAAYKYINGVKTLGDYSNIAYFRAVQNSETTKPAKVTGVKASVEKTVVTINWNQISDAAGYQIALTIPGGNTIYYTSTTNSVRISGITNTTSNYSVKVAAYKYINGVKTLGDYSNTVYFRGVQNSETTKPAKVTGLKVTMDGDVASFKWNQISGVNGYEMCLTMPNGHNIYYNVEKNSKVINGFTSEENYIVKVRAYKLNSSGKEVYGDYSNEVKFKGAPKNDNTIVEELNKVTGLTAWLSEKAINLDWNKVSGADGYEINLTMPGNRTGLLYSTTNSAVISGISTYNSLYTIKVRAYKVDTNGKKVYGDYSNPISIYRTK